MIQFRIIIQENSDNNKQTDEESISNDNKINPNKINFKSFNSNELQLNNNLDINIINLNKPKKKERKLSDSFEISADFSESNSSPDENNNNSNMYNSALFPLGLNQNTSLFNKISNYGQTNINTFNILKKKSNK